MNCLYRMFDADNRLLYVGVTCRGARRFDEHHAKRWWPSVTTVAVSHFPDRRSAFDAEALALMTEQPLHNLAGVPARLCGARTRNGLPCRHITDDGGPCPDHGGLTAWERRRHITPVGGLA